MPNPLVIYHGKCLDGMTAAWAVRKALGDGDYIPVSHGDTPPDVVGRDVVIVDFSYSRAVMETMALAARSLLLRVMQLWLAKRWRNFDHAACKSSTKNSPLFQPELTYLIGNGGSVQKIANQKTDKHLLLASYC